MLDPNYWDCECIKDYIRHKTEIGNSKCPDCGAYEDDQPDSRKNEVDKKSHDQMMENRKEQGEDNLSE